MDQDAKSRNVLTSSVRISGVSRAYGMGEQRGLSNGSDIFEALEIFKDQTTVPVVNFTFKLTDGLDKLPGAKELNDWFSTALAIET